MTDCFYTTSGLVPAIPLRWPRKRGLVLASWQGIKIGLATVAGSFVFLCRQIFAGKPKLQPQPSGPSLAEAWARYLELRRMFSARMARVSDDEIMAQPDPTAYEDALTEPWLAALEPLGELLLDGLPRSFEDVLAKAEYLKFELTVLGLDPEESVTRFVASLAKMAGRAA